MGLNKHEEPWKVRPTATPFLVDNGGKPVDHSGLLRAAQCVNACAGVEFHGETHEVVKELVIAIVDWKRSLLSYLKNTDSAVIRVMATIDGRRLDEVLEKFEVNDE